MAKKVHELKTWPMFFRWVANGDKPFEIRKNDRNFGYGDILVLREWSPDLKTYTAATPLRMLVTYVYEGPGVEAGYCVMGIRPEK